MFPPDRMDHLTNHHNKNKRIIIIIIILEPVLVTSPAIKKKKKKKRKEKETETESQRTAVAWHLLRSDTSLIQEYNTEQRLYWLHPSVIFFPTALVHHRWENTSFLSLLSTWPRLAATLSSPKRTQPPIDLAQPPEHHLGVWRPFDLSLASSARFPPTLSCVP